MKKLLLLSAASLFSFALAAQNIQIKDALGTVINGQTVTKIGTSFMTIVAVDDIDIYNNNSVDMDIKMKRYEINVQPGTGNSYCWSVCTNEVTAGQYPVWSLGPAQNILTGTSFIGWTADHYPHGIVGQNQYRYVWYDNANPSDSAELFVTFDIALGQEELNPDEYVLNVYPNPANSNVYFKVDGNNNKNVKILLTDALGKTVKSIDVPENNGLIKLQVGDLNPGVYFYSLQINRKAITTRRLMITR